MPFALIVLSGDTNGPAFVGPLAAALAFLLVGAGMHTTQTAGLALASDIAAPDKRHRVVALLYVMLLIGTIGASFAIAGLLSTFSQVRLIQVVQGAALATFALNLIALWKQEARRPELTRPDREVPTFSETWTEIRADRHCLRLLVVVALGTAGFGMQDVLLEPYGGEILGLAVAGTTALSALVGLGTLAGFALAARGLERSGDPMRLASVGVLVGVAAFSAVIFAAPLQSAGLFQAGAVLIGCGSGLFAVGTLTSAMHLVRRGLSGRVLGAWGAAQATALGVAIAISGPIRDVTTALAANGQLGPALRGPETGYLFVYHVELGLLFATLVAIGPMARLGPVPATEPRDSFGLSEHPG
jgi:BCD family chlorophyll transporter-like MFS transporter